MTTFQDILTDALVDSGAFSIGMPPPATAVQKALRRLNGMLSQWQVKRYLVYQLVSLSCNATGAQTYTIGPGGQFNCAPRPDKLNAAYMTQLNVSPGNPVDYPLRVLDTWEDYSRISLKELSTWCQWVFLDPGVPLGTLYFWPVPQAGLFTLRVVCKQSLGQVSDLSASVDLPAEYFEALYYNLMVRLRAAYNMAPRPDHVGLARDSLRVLRGANSQIPSMRFPRALRAERNKYNIYSDDN